MNDDRAMERVLLVGAFERDNFGDLLFHLVTRQALIEVGFAVDAGSVLGAEVEATPDHPVIRMHDALSTHEYRAVWVVGGEIGGVRVVDAFGMSLPERERRVFSAAEDGAKAVFARFASGMPLTAPAYLPDLEQYPVNSGATLIVHSVGVSNLARGLSPDALTDSVRILSRAEHLTVRDADSHEFLKAQSIHSVLAPDIIHSISTFSGWRSRDLVADGAMAPVLLHINEEQLSAIGLPAVIEAIAELWRLTGRKIRLFAAGITHGHDNVAAYDAMIAVLRERHPGVECDRTEDRSPISLVAEIAASALWIGTSLHGRILAEAYGVPRISLTNDKVARYARTWDESYPADLSLPDAVRVAPDLLRDPVRGGGAGSLADSARARLDHVISSLKGRAA